MPVVVHVALGARVENVDDVMRLDGYGSADWILQVLNLLSDEGCRP
jgi:hypothetical protein